MINGANPVRQALVLLLIRFSSEVVADEHRCAATSEENLIHRRRACGRTRLQRDPEVDLPAYVIAGSHRCRKIDGEPPRVTGRTAP